MHRTTVADVMASDVITASPDASFAELARLLHGAGVRAVPIIDPAGVLIGVVSEADLMASAARPDTAPGRWRARHIRRDQPEAKAGATTAAELMTALSPAPPPIEAVASPTARVVHLALAEAPGPAGEGVIIVPRSLAGLWDSRRCVLSS